MFSQRISSRMESRDCCFCDCRTEIRLQERSPCSKLLGLWSQGWLSSFYYLPGPDGLEGYGAHTHVDDFLIAFRKASKTYKDALKHLVRTLHVKQQSGTVVHGGRIISKDASHMW